MMSRGDALPGASLLVPTSGQSGGSCFRARTSRPQLHITSLIPDTNSDAYSRMQSRHRRCTMQLNPTGMHTRRLLSAGSDFSGDNARHSFPSLLPAALSAHEQDPFLEHGGSAWRKAGRTATRLSRHDCIQHSGCGKSKKGIAAALILRFDQPRDSRIVRCDKVCVCRTAQPPAARPQTPLQGGSAPVDPRDDRSERTR
jgi:hypothetical protein